MSDEQPPPLPDYVPAPPPEPEAPPAPPPVLRYVVGNAAGEIVRIVRCTADQAAAQAQPGECLAQHDEATSATHYLLSGDPVQCLAYSAPQLEAKAPRPHPSAGWDNAAMAWVDPRTLDQHKADRWAQIKAAREAADFGGFVWGGDTFDSDAMSQSRIQGAAVLAMQALAAQQPFAIDWTLADNTVRTLDGTDMAALGQALAVHVGTQHETARLLRAAIDAAADIAAVEAIAWPT